VPRLGSAGSVGSPHPDQAGEIPWLGGSGFEAIAPMPYASCPADPGGSQSRQVGISDRRNLKCGEDGNGTERSLLDLDELCRGHQQLILGGLG
jgi:hypothetical protein